MFCRSRWLSTEPHIRTIKLKKRKEKTKKNKSALYYLFIQSKSCTFQTKPLQIIIIIIVVPTHTDIIQKQIWWTSALFSAQQVKCRFSFQNVKTMNCKIFSVFTATVTESTMWHIFSLFNISFPLPQLILSQSPITCRSGFKETEALWKKKTKLIQDVWFWSIDNMCWAVWLNWTVDGTDAIYQNYKLVCSNNCCFCVFYIRTTSGGGFYMFDSWNRTCNVKNVPKSWQNY